MQNAVQFPSQPTASGLSLVEMEPPPAVHIVGVSAADAVIRIPLFNTMSVGVAV